MVSRLVLQHMFGLFIFLISCAPLNNKSSSTPLDQQTVRSSEAWNPNERSGLETPGRFISVPLDPQRPQEGSFDLYYFVLGPISGKPGGKTVLFSAGGPGEIVQRDKVTTFAEFLTKNEYNVVYFHIRGSGFSQLPEADRFDRFLKTVYAVEDIEKIRQDFLGSKQWDGIIGWSYGAVLAQQYGSKYPEKVGKLVLAAPLSNHKNDFTADEHLVRRETLKKVYETDPTFKYVKKTDKDKILDEVFGTENRRDKYAQTHMRIAGYDWETPIPINDGGILKKIEEVFGNDQYVVSEYCNLKQTGILKENGLDQYSFNFFRSLREIRLHGWKDFPGGQSGREDRNRLAKVIAIETIPSLKEELGEQEPSTECLEQQRQGSERTLYAMRMNDGFMSRLRSAVNAKVNKFIAKLKMHTGERVERWDPAKCPRDRPSCLPTVPALVLKGGADPVTSGEQAEYVFTHLLRGSRTFLEFPGIGHSFRGMPQVEIPPPFLSGTVRFQPMKTSSRIDRVMGRIHGPKLVKQIELIPPENLRSRIEVVSISLEPGSSITTVVLNKGPESIPAGAQNWTARSPFFTGTVSFVLGAIEAGQTAKATGSISQITVHKQLELAPPKELKAIVLGAKFGRVLENSPPREQENQITVMIKNEGQTSINNLEPLKWTVRNSFFTGALRFTDQPEIPPGGIRHWIGDVVNIQVQNQVELVQPENLESQLQVVNVELDPSNQNQLIVTIKNLDADPVKSVGRNWTVQSPFYTANVRLELGTLKGGEISQVTGSIRNIKVKPRLKLEVTPNTLEQGLKFEGFEAITDENTLSVVVGNTGRDTVEGMLKEWTITSPVFTGTVQMRPGKIRADEKVRVTGTILPQVQPKRASEMIVEVPLGEETTLRRTRAAQPSQADPDYEFIGDSLRIESENMLSVLVKNKSARSLQTEPRSWIYAVEDSEGVCQGSSIESRDCLIYAFLEMEFPDFTNEGRNQILRAIKTKFNDEVIIKHCGKSEGPEACQLSGD